MQGDFGKNRSYLILIGGAEDKTGEKAILKRVVRIARAKKILLIPTASAYPRDMISDYQHAFRSLGVPEMDAVDIRYPEDVDREEHLALVEKADLIFFSGGDQVKLVEIFKKSLFLKRIKERFFAGNLPIAGTSAGAAAASDVMIWDGDYRGFIKGSVNFGEGFGLLEKISVDTHFLHRERLPRLTQFLANEHVKNTKAIGIDENTAVFISPNLRCRIIGSGMVTVISTERVTFSDYNYIENDSIFSINNLQVGFLSPGTTFSLKRWAVLKSNDVKKKYYELVSETGSYSNLFFN